MRYFCRQTIAGSWSCEYSRESLVEPQKWVEENAGSIYRRGRRMMPGRETVRLEVSLELISRSRLDVDAGED